MPPARSRASRARSISRAASGARARAVGVANDRIESPSSAFVVLRHQPLQQPHTPTRTPALVDIALRRRKAGAGNVEVRPWRLFDKARQNLRGGDRAGVAPTRVLHVGEFRIEFLVVLRTA